MDAEAFRAEVRRRLAEADRRRAAALEAMAASLAAAGAAVDPELAELEREYLERMELERRYGAGARRGKSERLSGWGGGRTGQCSGCKAPRGHSQLGPCRQCGYQEGAGYVGVPASTSYLER